jgi:hypothetical protein
MIPDELKIRATNRAQVEGISLGEFIRVSLEKALRASDNEYPYDSYLADNSIYEGEIPKDLAQNHDEYLYGV